MATQLFKFVSPRDPQTVTNETEVAVFDLSGIEVFSAYAASPYARLMEVLATTDQDADTQISRLNVLLEDFAQSSAFMADLPALQAKLGPWVTFYDRSIQLLSPQTPSSNVPAAPADTAKVLFAEASDVLMSRSAENGWISEDDMLLVASNLLAHTLSGAQPVMISKLASIFKTLNFLQHAAKAAEDVANKTAFKWLSLPIGLPAGITIPVSKTKAPVAPDNSAELEETRVRFQLYQDYGIAHDEVLNLVKRQGLIVKEAKGDQDSQQEAEDDYVVGILNAEDMAELSRSTLTIFTSLNFKIGDKIPAILCGIVEHGTEAANALGVDIMTERPTMVVGDNVMYVDDFRREVADVIWNEDEDGGVVIGHHRPCGLRFPFKIANLRIVEQELLAYEPGYIAHIQNTLQGEFNEKTTRRLLRTEESFSSSKESEYTDERDTQTTDRFSMEKETSRTLQEDTEVYVNGELSASYGPVSLSIGAGYSNNTSLGESNSEAVSYAKEVVQRSLQRLIEKSKEERSTKTINEFEETNRHGLDNRGGDSHVVGVYRWLDQLNKVTIKTYDKRMMIELMIPQPAKYHLSNFTEDKDIQVSMEEPVHPSELSISGVGGSVSVDSHKDINAFNYGLLAANYGATIDPMPQQFKAIASSIADGGAKDTNAAALKETKDIVIPAGYQAYSMESTYSSDNGSAWANHIYMGGNWLPNNGIWNAAAPFDFEGATNAITVRWNSSFIGASFHITCILTDYAFEEWQIKTYNSILDAYEKKKAAYDNAVAEAKANSGVRIRGTNPSYNKQLIRSELKKQALYMMSHCKFIDNVKVYGDGSVKNCCEAFDKGQVIKFVDNIFEWGNITYSLYDYFYAKKEEWALLYNISDPDPLMNNFLRAGEARVIIPVAKGKEVAAMNFLTLGRPYVADLMSMDILDVADEFFTEEPLEEIVIFDDAPLADPPLKPLVTPTTLTILECGTGGIDPEKYLINGMACAGVMTPVITGEVVEPHEEEVHEEGSHGG